MAIVPNKHGLKVIKNIMEQYDIPYDCELFEVSRIVEEHYPTSRSRNLFGIEYTNEVQDAINYIRDNDLLGREVKI